MRALGSMVVASDLPLLVSLLDYPNEGTREAVRLFLVQWPSAEGLRRLHGELDEAVESGRPPEPCTLDALVFGGEEVIAPLLRLALEHPETLESLHVERATGKALAKQLRASLAKETEPSHVRALGQLLKLLGPREGEEG